MVKEKRIVIFNKGVRNWPLKDEGKDVSVAPNKPIELPKSVADRMVKNYPDDFIHGDSMAVRGSGTKALNAKIKKLEAENEIMTQNLEDAKGRLERLEELEKIHSKTLTEFDEVKAKREELKKENEYLKSPVQE